MQRSDSAAEEILPNHLQGKPGNGEVVDPGGGDLELVVLGIDVAPVVPADRRRLAYPAELLRIVLLNPAPLSPPFFPPPLLGTLRVRPFGLGDLGDATRNGASLLDAWVKIMAEERRVGKNSGKALTEVGEQSHARHGVWSKIQKVEAKCVHDIVEEIRERGQRPQEK